jgi:hypothetical protein
LGKIPLKKMMTSKGKKCWGRNIFCPIELDEQTLKNYRDFGWQFLILPPLPQR